MLSDEDRELISAIQDGAEDAAERLYLRFRPYLTRFVRGRVPVTDEDDLVQETLMTAFRKLQANEFLEKSSIGTWVIGILRNKLLSWHDHKGREQATLISLKSSALERIADGRCPDPLASLHLDELLAQLPRSHRAVMVLRIHNDCSTEQIAKMLGKPPGTVGRMLVEATVKLRMLSLKNRPDKSNS